MKKTININIINPLIIFIILAILIVLYQIFMWAEFAYSIVNKWYNNCDYYWWCFDLQWSQNIFLIELIFWIMIVFYSFIIWLYKKTKLPLWIVYIIICYYIIYILKFNDIFWNCMDFCWFITIFWLPIIIIISFIIWIIIWNYYEIKSDKKNIIYL